MDQILDGMSSPEGSATDFASLVSEDPSNPFAWCAYGDSLAVNGHVDLANNAFRHAVELGPRMPPVLMRAANFEFSHGHVREGIALSHKILQTTPEFDEVLFSYFTSSRLGPRDVLDSAIPASPQPARAWLTWIAAHGSDGDVSVTWDWMKSHRLLDAQLAGEITGDLWSRRSFEASQELWTEWLGPHRGNCASPEVLLDCEFQDSASKSPFVWNVLTASGAAVFRKNGLEIEFSGSENSEMILQELVTIAPGRYEFSADVESDAITTDQRPFFIIFDVENRARLDIRTPPVPENMPRGKMNIAVSAPYGTRALGIQLVRSRSERFDNKISGKLHVYRVSFLPVVQARN